MKSWVKNIHKSADPVAAEALASAMSDISEEYECAGWLIGLEFKLWEMLRGGARELAMGDVTDEEVDNLRRLSERAGGWVFWRDNDDPFKSGECFEPYAEWQLRNEQHSR